MVVTVENPKIPKISFGDDNSRDGRDRFSNLPEPIIHYIFSFLGTIDVIRVSAVSRKWRYFWISMPYLNFDVDRVWSNPQEKWSLQTINEKFKDFVNWLLLSQDWSIDILRFRLSCLYCEDDYTLHRWISILSRRNVQELDLKVSHDEADFPRTLLRCESLVTLKLQGYHSVLRLPRYFGFMRLESIVFKRIKFTDHVLFQNFILSCPLLESLTMFACVFHDFKILDISSTSMKNIAIDNDGACSTIHGDGLRTCELKVACPNLVSFSYEGPLAKDFYFQDLNFLQDVSILIESYLEKPAHRNIQELDLKVSCEGADFPRALSCESLVTLKLHGCHSVLKLPSYLGSMRLKSIDFKEIKLMDYVLFQSFISSCPLLESLTMFVCVFHDFKILDISSTSMKNLSVQNDGTCCTIHGDGLHACELKVACPNLVSLTYEGPLAKDFSFVDLNSLQDVSIFIESHSKKPVRIECHRLMVKILEGVRYTKRLKLEGRSLEFLYPSLGTPVSTFHNLKSLKLVVILEETLQSIINLLNCSPSLEALSIFFDFYKDTGWKISDQAIECLTCNLKTVELIEFTGSKNELEFIRFMLQNGHVLQKINMHGLEGLENSKEIISAVMKFPRSFTNVELLYDNLGYLQIDF